MTTIELWEADETVERSMPSDIAAALAGFGACQVAPSGDDLWRISGVSKVGVVRIGDTTVRLHPKVPINALFFMLARSRHWRWWRNESVRMDRVDDVLPVVVASFVRSAMAALNPGVHQSYVTVEDSESVIRGRLRVDEQIRRRFGLALPVELTVDEYTADVAENRLIRSAALRLLRLAGIPDASRPKLHWIDRALVDVTPIPGGQALPSVHFDRRNARYRNVVELARLILGNATIHERAGSMTASAFLLPMEVVFEEFLEVELRDALAEIGGEVVPQQRSWLDVQGRVLIKPDLVWVDAGFTRAVIDAKYKAEKLAGYPNADIYQMAAYCARLGLPIGHLVYAAGNENPARYDLHHGVSIVCHALRLDVPPESLLGQLRALAATIESMGRGAVPA